MVSQKTHTYFISMMLFLNAFLLTKAVYSASTSELPTSRGTIMSQDEEIKKHYGSMGCENILKVQIMCADNLITFDPVKKLFEITNSSEMSQESIQKKFYSCTYRSWEPEVQTTRSAKGNILIKLVPITIKNKEIYEKADHSALQDMPLSLYQAGGILEAGQSSMAFGTGASPQYILATAYCTTCVAFAGWDPNSKAGFLVHFTNAGEFLLWEKELANFAAKAALKFDDMQVHIRGGWEGASEETINIITQWIKCKNIVVKSASILKNMATTSESLALNTRDGQVYSYNPIKNPHSQFKWNYSYDKENKDTRSRS